MAVISDQKSNNTLSLVKVSQKMHVRGWLTLACILETDSTTRANHSKLAHHDLFHNVDMPLTGDMLNLKISGDLQSG